MPKIIFIEPKAPNLHIFSKFTLPRLGSFILGTMMEKRGWDVEIIIEQLSPLFFNQFKDVDLIGISTITSTAPRAYAIADRFRKMGKTVLLGGPHVTFLADEALQHADYVIRGEGENALMEFIDHWESDGNYSAIPNLSFRTGQGLRHNPIRAYKQDLDAIPYPNFSLARRIFPRIAGHQIIPIQTSRGCPYDCSFCSVTGMFGRQYRFRSTENIIAELRRYDHPKNHLFFYDDHFTANRKRTKDLLRAMIAEEFKFRWSTQVRVEIANDLELVTLMKQANCHTLYIGLESVNPESLAAMQKQQTVEDIRRAIGVLQKHHIHVHGMFVYGFDQDDWKTVKETVRFAKRARLTSTQFLILTPLPGSAFYKQIAKENRIRFQDWSLYDAHHAVFLPKRFTMAKLQKAQLFSHATFYSKRESIKKLLEGRWLAIGIAHYARGLNRFWKKKNKTYLNVLDLLNPKMDVELSIDYKEKIDLNLKSGKTSKKRQLVGILS